MLSEFLAPLLGLLPPSTVMGLSVDTPWEMVSRTLLLSAFYFDMYSTLDLEVTWLSWKFRWSRAKGKIAFSLLAEGWKNLPSDAVRVFKIVILSFWKRFKLTLGLGCVPPNWSYWMRTFQRGDFQCAHDRGAMIVAPRLTPPTLAHSFYGNCS